MDEPAHLRNSICKGYLLHSFFVIKKKEMIKILSSAEWLYKLLICLYNGIVSNYYFKKEMGIVFMN